MTTDDYDLVSIDGLAEPVLGIQKLGPARPGCPNPASKCAGEICCIHNQSDHHMRAWPMNWARRPRPHGTDLPSRRRPPRPRRPVTGPRPRLRRLLFPDSAKRAAPMKRGKPLARRTPLRGGRPPTRTAMTTRVVRRRRRADAAASWEFWAHLREALYVRARGQCERCGAYLNDSGMEAHHRKLRSQGGLDELVNLVALCPSCHHDGVHAHPAKAREDGWIVLSTADPAETPVSLWDGSVAFLTADGGLSRRVDGDGL